MINETKTEQINRNLPPKKVEWDATTEVWHTTYHFTPEFWARLKGVRP